MAWNRKDYPERKAKIEAAVKDAIRYFDALPNPVSAHHAGPSGGINVQYSLPDPHHRATYWPLRNKWRRVRRFSTHEVELPPLTIEQRKVRYARDPEDFIRQFAPGSFAPEYLSQRCLRQR